MNFNRRRPPRPVQRTYDFGRQPYVANLNNDTVRNTNYRTAIWTGSNLQMTLMSINAHADVGLEQHRDVDQFFYIESGVALVLMGSSATNLTFRQTATKGFGVFIPAGMWHNLMNVGDGQLKMFAVYAPPEHPFGTVETTNPGTAQPVVPNYPALRPVSPPVVVVPQVPVRPSHPTRPPSGGFPQTPLNPARPISPPMESVPQTPMYPSMPVPMPAPPMESVPQTPMYPAMPVPPMMFELDSAEKEEN